MNKEKTIDNQETFPVINKKFWVTPEISELLFSYTKEADYYNDDGFGPGASLS